MFCYWLKITNREKYPGYILVWNINENNLMIWYKIIFNGLTLYARNVLGSFICFSVYFALFKDF